MALVFLVLQVETYSYKLNIIGDGLNLPLELLSREEIFPYRWRCMG